MSAWSILPGLNRAGWLRAADWFALAVAVTLPWSTTATGIFIALWLITILPAMEFGMLRRELTRAAGFLPVALWVLAAIGMLWADVTWAERLAGLGKFHRLLLIPVLLAHFRVSERGIYVVYGFFSSVLLLLIVSWGLAVIPGLPWRGMHQPGVPAKDYIFQSTDFLICAFALLGYAVVEGRARRWRLTLVLIILSGLFLANIFFVISSRTSFVVAPVLLLLFGWRQFGWRGFVGAGLIAVLLGVGIWFGSPYVRERIDTSLIELRYYRESNTLSSTALHLEFLRKSVLFIEAAPIIGHGTGSIGEEFRNAALGQTGASAELVQNPHNQIFAVAIQLGIIGAALLLAMWAAHLILFAREGLIAWMGLVLVTENIVSSLFNSHLFDFTSGWLYVFGVGVLGGMVLRERDAAAVSAP
jgi:O-antigen ligase